MLLDMQGGWKTEERGGIEVIVCDYWSKSSCVSLLESIHFKNNFLNFDMR